MSSTNSILRVTAGGNCAAGAGSAIQTWAKSQRAETHDQGISVVPARGGAPVCEPGTKYDCARNWWKTCTSLNMLDPESFVHAIPAKRHDIFVQDAGSDQGSKQNLPLPKSRVYFAFA